MAKTLEERRTRREILKAQRQQGEDWRTAELRASAMAYSVMRILRGENGHRWEYLVRDYLYGDCQVVSTCGAHYESTTLEYTPATTIVPREDRTRRVRVTVPGRFIGTIETNSGQTLMVVFNNNDGRGDVAYAVGGSGVVGYVAEVYGFDYSTVRVRGLES